ncbi:hypothetical protein BH09ACT6_BH09ACT6_18640 [soil metagenome]
MDYEGKEFLTLNAACRRVRRHRRTLRRWMAEGMEFHWFEGMKYVELTELQSWLRKKIVAEKEFRFSSSPRIVRKSTEFAQSSPTADNRHFRIF